MEDIFQYDDELFRKLRYSYGQIQFDDEKAICLNALWAQAKPFHKTAW
jgi:hypothetical protein